MAEESPAGSELRKRLAQLAIEGDFDQVRKLATKELVQARDDSGRTVLMLVADSNWTPQPTGKCIEYFLHLGSDPSAADIAGNTAAHVAAKRNHLRLLALLPFDAKFVANKEGVTPLMVAVQHQSWQCATHLLYLFRQKRYFEHKAELLGMKNSKGQTVLQLAEESGQSDLASVIERELRLVLTEEDGEYKISGLTVPEKAAGEELRQLVWAGDATGLERTATCVTCDLPDDHGWTALMWAVLKSADSGTVQQLLALGADATCADVWGHSCLHCAADGGSAAAVAALAAAGAPVNAWGGTEIPDDWTPLVRAAWYAPPATAAATGQALLDAGADWSLENRRGVTALDWAKFKNRSELAGILLAFEDKAFFDQPLQLSEADKRAIEERKQQDDEEREAKEKHPERSDGFYPVTDPQGICLILNINRYSRDSGCDRRDGSEHDVSRITSLFRRLQFKIRTKEDLTGDEVLKSLRRVSRTDHSEFGIFVCFLMAHGHNDVIIASDGKSLQLRDLAMLFGATNCPSLNRKPKIFFVQSCRAGRVNEMVASARMSPGSELFCPNEADFLFSCANSEGSQSFRNPNSGSPFIQTLCDVIEDNFQQDHLVDMVAEVNSRVTRRTFCIEGNRFHTMPDLVTHLDRQVSLDPSKAALLDRIPLQ